MGASARNHPRLSEREAHILDGLVQGHANKVIARSCDITEATVKVHMKSILRKIQVANRTQAAIWALEHGHSADIKSRMPADGGGQIGATIVDTSFRACRTWLSRKSIAQICLTASPADFADWLPACQGLPLKNGHFAPFRTPAHQRHRFNMQRLGGPPPSDRGRGTRSPCQRLSVRTQWFKVPFLDWIGR